MRTQQKRQVELDKINKDREEINSYVQQRNGELRLRQAEAMEAKARERQKEVDKINQKIKEKLARPNH